MRKAEYPEEVRTLVTQLRRLPGIGGRSAERIAISLLRGKHETALDLVRAVHAAATRVDACPVCGFYRSVEATCILCDAPDRDRSLLCVVEQPTDVLPLDRTGAFAGLYHILGGRLSPLDNIHPEDLRIDPLLRRVDGGNVAEVVLAVSSDVEGEATAHYLGDLLAQRPHVRVTRLAQGLPAGGGLEHADELTLFRALQGRRGLAG